MKIKDFCCIFSKLVAGLFVCVDLQIITLYYLYRFLISFLFNIVLILSVITLPTKVHIVKALVFPLVMYRCESWTIKKAEH